MGNGGRKISPVSRRNLEQDPRGALLLMDRWLKEENGEETREWALNEQKNVLSTVANAMS